VFVIVNGVPPVPARPVVRWTPIIAALVMSLAGCSSAGLSGPARPSAATDHPSSVPSVAAVASPEPTAAASASDVPPSASSAVDGGDPVTGQLGSFTWDGAGSDSPWLPGSPIAIGGGERLTVSLATDPGVAGWTARRVAPGTMDGAGALGLGQGATLPITFAAPPAGTWSVQVTVQFANGRGSAAYYWRVTVH
jgi:hypothetical protein